MPQFNGRILQQNQVQGGRASHSTSWGETTEQVTKEQRQQRQRQQQQKQQSLPLQSICKALCALSFKLQHSHL